MHCVTQVVKARFHGKIGEEKLIISVEIFNMTPDILSKRMKTERRQHALKPEFLSECQFNHKVNCPSSTF